MTQKPRIAITTGDPAGIGPEVCLQLLNEPSLIERAEILRDKGTNRAKFLEGQVDKYSWVDVGSSYSPSELVAAFLYAQLKKVDQIQESRKRIWNHYARPP